MVRAMDEPDLEIEELRAQLARQQELLDFVLECLSDDYLDMFAHYIDTLKQAGTLGVHSFRPAMM